MNKQIHQFKSTFKERSHEYAHKEAFCLMEYRDDVTGESEYLWNSRDGVTPFGIQSRRGNQSFHVNFQLDRRRVDFKPSKGMRIFVDARPDHAHIINSARAYVDKYWGASDPDGMGLDMSTHPAFVPLGKDGAVDHFIKEWTKPGSPTVIEVE